MTARRQMLFWALGAAVALALLALLKGILLPFVAGMAVAYFLDPAVDRVERLGLVRWLATSVITLGFFVVGAAIVVLLFPLVQTQVALLIENMPAYVEKVQGEIVGSTLYAGMTEFLRTRPDHVLDFSPQERKEVRRLADHHLELRWRMLEQSFRRIAGLRDAIRQLARPEKLQDLLGYLDRWFTPESFDRIRFGVSKHDSSEVEDFLISLQRVADDFATTTVNIDFIHAQLEACTTRDRGT